MTIKPGLIALAAFVLVLRVPAANAESIENLFDKAARYTVKIETNTLNPFLGDAEGVAFGSGFLVDKRKGWVLTNRHVVAEGPSIVDVRFKETDYVTAEKAYLDPVLDLALIRISPEQVPREAIEAPLACNADISLGTAVVIYGHPSGLNFTGTRGIVSGMIFIYGNEWIQTDAPLNSGNSGGPLISVDSGKVIGVNAAKHGDDDSEGLNFTVSIDHACRIIELIENDQNPSPPLLPVVFVDHDRDYPELVVAKSFLDDQSLLLPGDIVTGVSGSDTRVTNIDQLLFQLRGKQGHQELDIVRDGREKTVKIPLAPHPYLLNQRAMAFSGLTIKGVNYVDGVDSELESNVFVVSVLDGSPASWEGFDAWDSIYSVNGKVVAKLGLEELYDALLPHNNSGERVDFLLKYYSGKKGSNYNYYATSIEIDDLKMLTQ